MLINNKEKRSFKRINQLIFLEDYQSAIEEVNLLINHTTRIRKCHNLKAYCYLKMNDFTNALQLYENCYPYVMIDDDDIYALKCLAVIYKALGNNIRYNKYNFSYSLFTLPKNEHDRIIKEFQKKSNYAYEIFLKNKECSKEILEVIISENIEMLRITEASIFYAYGYYLGIKFSDYLKEEFENYYQAQKFLTEILSNIDNIYCVISESILPEKILRDNCLVKAISKVGKIVYHLVPNNYKDLNKETNNDLVVQKNNITKIKTIKNAVIIDDIKDELYKIESQNSSLKPILLLGNSDILKEINEDVEFSKIIEMYFRHYEEQPIKKKDCVLLGNYFKSISYLWGYNVQAEFDKKPSCDFSIIIPVRNSIKYLRDTIETCLDQDFNGSWEILISDNGWHNNSLNIRKFLKSFKSNKIRYIKTPYDLSLTKSFEFGFLNARGRYLISLGSDDGLIRTALSTISKATDLYPNNSIIMWPCAFYRWPQYQGSDQNQLFFSKVISKPERIYEINTDPLIKKAVLGCLDTTEIPSMYLVTCVKREHIDRIFETTGKFEDGNSQDGYTGMLNLFLENKVTYVEYPIVIAGNSEIGTGSIAEQKLNSISTFGKLFKIRYLNYRYQNYFSNYYRGITNTISLGTKYLLFREFVLIERYKIKQIKLDKREKYNILYNVHDWLPLKTCDLPLYFLTLERIALSFGVTFYNRYLLKRKKWLFFLIMKKFSRQFIKNNKIIRYFMLKIYRAVAIIYNMNNKKKSVGSKKLILGYNLMRKTIHIDLNKYNVSGVKKGAELLLKHIT